MKPIQIHSLQEYMDIVSQYEEYEDDLYRGLCYEWDITESKQLSDPAVWEVFGQQKYIPRDCLKYLHKLVRFRYTAGYGVLLGVQVTEDDFYWIVKYPDKINYITCVSNIIPVED